MAASLRVAAILRDAVLRTAPQDEVGGCCVSHSVRLVHGIDPIDRFVRRGDPRAALVVARRANPAARRAGTRSAPTHNENAPVRYCLCATLVGMWLSSSQPVAVTTTVLPILTRWW